MINGNAAKGRKPLTNFIKEMNRFPGLLDIALGISGLVSRRGSHASGVIFFDSDKIYDTCPIMKTPSGAIITQWDLHNVEKAGAVKYDFLLTSVQDIIVQTIKLLQKDNIIDPNLTIRQVYNKYLAPEKLPMSDKKIWEALKDGSVIDCFQFDSAVGHLAAKKIQPKTIDEMTDCNGSSISPYTLYL